MALGSEAQVAFPRIRLNEGSLLRRTMLHIAAFVVASMAFIGVVSLMLCSIAKGIVSPKSAEAAEDDPKTALVTTPTAPRMPGAPAPFGRPGARGGAAKRFAVPGVTTPNRPE